MTLDPIAPCNPIRALRSLAAVIGLFLGVMVAAPARADWPHDPWSNVLVAPSTGAQSSHQVISDGAGGVIVAWVDFRAVAGAVFVQRITAGGQVAPGWPASGRAVSGAVAGAQAAPVLVSDGLGGALVAWQDDRLFGSALSDIYLQHVAPSGAIASGWPANGVRLTSDSHDENNPTIAADGTGGAFVVWETVFAPGNPGDIDLYGSRVLGNSNVVWANLALYAPIDEQKSPRVVSDGAGGFVLCFLDNYDGAPGGSTLYAVKAKRFTADPLEIFFVDVSNGAYDNKENQVVADGNGGFLFAWQDYRNGNPDVYAMRLTSAGAPIAGWSANGVPACTNTANQSQVQMVCDGNRGAFLAWQDLRDGLSKVYALHFLADAGIPAAWTPGSGNSIAVSSGVQSTPSVIADGTGGAYFAWNEFRDRVEVYAIRTGATPAPAAGWSSSGNLISSAGNLGSKLPKLVAGGDGAIAALLDQHGGPIQVYAQRFDRFGALGNPAPAITSIRDVQADQGGRVRLTWSPSWMDSDPGYGIWAYWVWRQVPAAFAQTAVVSGAAWLDDGQTGTLLASARVAVAVAEPNPGRLFMRSNTFSASDYAWEFLASQPASGLQAYSYTASTTTDSMAGSNPATVFMVQARGIAPNTYWSSPADSGHSVDNLAPATPNPFTGAYVAGATHLHWGANTDVDFTEYRLYRGAAAGFVPGPGNRVATSPDTGYADPGSAGAYYKLSAVDVHGNESGFALLTPSGTVGVATIAPPRVLWLAPPSPNPARGPTSLRFTLPVETDARVAVFDVGGRQVAELLNRRLPAGEHGLRWNGLDPEGRRATRGVYWLRLETREGALTRRLVRME